MLVNYLRMKKKTKLGDNENYMEMPELACGQKAESIAKRVIYYIQLENPAAAFDLQEGSEDNHFPKAMRRHQYCWKPLAGYLLQAETDGTKAVVQLDNIISVIKVGLQNNRSHSSVFSIRD